MYAASKKWMIANPGTAFGGLTVATLAAITLGESLRKNKKTYNITSIKTGTTGGIIVKYSPPEQLSRKDLIQIKGSNSVPSIDGESLAITRIIDSSTIELPGLAVTTEGTSGTFILSTTFSNQLGVSLNTLGESVGSSVGSVASGVGTAAGAAGKGIASGTTSAASGIFSGLLEGLGIDPRTGSIILYIIVFIVIIFLFYYVYSWINYATSSSYVPPPPPAPIQPQPAPIQPQQPYFPQQYFPQQYFPQIFGAPPPSYVSPVIGAPPAP